MKNIIFEFRPAECGYQDRGGGFYEIEYGLMKGSGSGKEV